VPKLAPARGNAESQSTTGGRKRSRVVSGAGERFDEELEMNERPQLLPVVWEGGSVPDRDAEQDLYGCVGALAEAGCEVSVLAHEENEGAAGDDAGASAGTGLHVTVAHREAEDLGPSADALCTVGRTAVGTLKISQEAAAAASSLAEIWVPSEFSLIALASSGVPEEKIRLVPSPVAGSWDRPDLQTDHSHDGSFVFLSNLDWNYEKGLDVVLEAFAREFRSDEGATLVLRAPSTAAAEVFAAGDRAAFLEETAAWLMRCMRCTLSEEDERRLFRQAVQALPERRQRDTLLALRRVEIETAAEIRKAISEEMGVGDERTPDIRVVGGALAECFTPHLYSACDAFVMAPRSEAWGRGFLDAMAFGLPAIGTRWGGHLDFMRPDNSYLVRVRALVDSRDDELQRGDKKLAEPDVEHLRELMRRVFELRAEAKERAARGAVHVRARNSPARVGALMAERLAALGRSLDFDLAEAA